MKPQANFMRLLGTKDEEFLMHLHSIMEFWRMNQTNLTRKFKRQQVERIIDWCEAYLADRIPHNKKGR